MYGAHRPGYVGRAQYGCANACLHAATVAAEFLLEAEDAPAHVRWSELTFAAMWPAVRADACPALEVYLSLRLAAQGVPPDTPAHDARFTARRLAAEVLTTAARGGLDTRWNETLGPALAAARACERDAEQCEARNEYQGSVHDPRA